MNRNQKIKLFLFIGFLALAVVFAVSFPRLTLPFGFSYIIYLISKPLTLRLTTGSKKQRVTYFIILMLGIFFISLPFISGINNVNLDVSRYTDHLPEIKNQLQMKYQLLKSKAYEGFGITLNIDPVNYIIARVEQVGSFLLKSFPNYLSSLFEWMLLVPLFLYFFFIESENVSRKIFKAVPNSIFEKSYVLFSQFNMKFGEYMIAKFIEATILGMSVTIGLYLIGFPNPFILGFISGVTNILPYIGPVIGIIPAIIVGLVSKDPNVSMLGMFLVYSIANLIDMVLVFPLLVSKIVNLHPIVVVVSVIIGSQLAGITGMIVVIPFVAFFKLLFIEIYKDLSVNS